MFNIKKCDNMCHYNNNNNNNKYLKVLVVNIFYHFQ